MVITKICWAPIVIGAGIEKPNGLAVGGIDRRYLS